MSGDLGFTHLFEPPAGPGAPVLLLLHGTGGDEHDLLPLGRALAPDAGTLSPRGKVREQGMPRFFRRFADGVFDVEDLRRRTAELAEFVSAAADAYHFGAAPVVAVGYSNGANIAASLLLLAPRALAGAILFRAMVPLVPQQVPALPRTPVLVSNGRDDPYAADGETDRLVALLRQAGADVTLEWQPAGHGLTPTDVEVARDWLARHTGSKTVDSRQ